MPRESHARPSLRAGSILGQITDASGARTLAAADMGNSIACTHATATVITLPADGTLPLYSEVELLQAGAGPISIAMGADFSALTGSGLTTDGVGSTLTVRVTLSDQVAITLLRRTPKITLATSAPVSPAPVAGDLWVDIS